RITLKNKNQNGGNRSQRRNADGKSKAVAAKQKLMRHESIAGENRGEARKIGKSGIGGDDENTHRRKLKDIIQNTFAVYQMPQLRNDRLLRVWIRFEKDGENRNTNKKRCQNCRHDRQGRRGV